MLKKSFALLVTVFVSGFLFIACNDVNSPEERDLDFLENSSFQTIESDLALLKDGGMPIDETDGVFSIGWNEVFRPVDDELHVRGMAFAVAFGEPNDFHKFGINMGSVFINYGDHQTELHKKTNDRRGTMYSLFKKPFGHSDQLLEYIPDIEYEFQVTGSDAITSFSFSLTSPSALMDITSHEHGNVIDPAQDLTITWDGGKADGKTAVRLMANTRFDKGPRGKGPKGPRPPRHPHPDHIIFEILDTNTGEYTFTSAQIQQLLSNVDSAHLMVGVSQMDIGEVEHDGKVFHSVMRNGNSVKLLV
ncbi:MAG: hypothetical protein WBH40_04070, partial [Ignavibacteriaceae bacterium]